MMKMKGKIKWYKKDKGYGFIIGEDEEEYFIHHTQLEKRPNIKPYQGCTFKPVRTDKGRQAQNIVLDQFSSE